MGVNRFSSDLEDIIKGISRIGKKENVVKKGWTKLTEASMKLGKLSDDASKIAVYEFAKNTDKGRKLLKRHALENPEELSKRIFFDYTDLTDFEVRYMKAIFHSILEQERILNSK